MGKIEFSEWLKATMEDKELKPATLARLAGLSESQISRIRSGEQGVGIDTAVLIARGLGVPPD